jgi:hypothetical protein
MTTTTLTHSPLTSELIESVIETLPVQSRIMVRLLLLQYLEPSEDDVQFIVEDQPDSRFMAGDQPETKKSLVAATHEVNKRIAQYSSFLRQKRERPWLQVECLKKQMALTDLTIRAAEGLLTSKFRVDRAELKDRKQSAVAALPRPEIRRLERGLEQEEIAEDDYHRDRMLIEYQTLLRRRERQRRRLKNAEQEYELSGLAPLQDHEVAHIWGIPLGSLSARKVKALTRYLSALRTRLEQEAEAAGTEQTHSDLWRETLRVLSRKPSQRSIVSFIPGIERTEEALLEKLKTFADGTMPEAAESGFWQLITRIHDSEHSGPWHSHARAIFALQRLFAIQADSEPTLDELEEDLLKATRPKSKDDALPAQQADEQPAELSEQALGVLNALAGEIDDKRTT